MAELMAGAALGALASEALERLIAAIETVLAFEPVSKELASTVKVLEPIIKEIVSLQKANDLKSLTDIIDKAEALVKKCGGVHKMNIIKQYRYTKKVWKIQREMVSFCQGQLQFLQHRNILQSIEKLDNMMKYIDDNLQNVTKQLDLLMKTVINNHQIVIGKFDSASKERNDYHQAVMEKIDHPPTTAPIFRDLCSVPKLGKAPVGLDGPLKELKNMLFDDSVDCLVVSAPPGCGKITLVTQLCHDEDIKGTFKHIFYNVVSSAPNFRKLVQDLLLHNGYQALTFENDSQAVAELRNLLENLKGPILLVLDNVWRGSETLLQKFRINLPDYKILVTSRFDFPSFGSIYILKPLEDEDARALLVQWASRPYNTSQAEYEDLLQKILKRCNGFPIVIEVIGVSLKGRSLNTWKGQVESWSEGETILHNPHPTVLDCLQPSFNALESNLKECFLDMGLFLEDQKIRASVIIDIWMELYGKSSTMCMKYLEDLASQNLLKLVPLGKNDPADGFYYEFLVTQYDILRELAIHQSLESNRLNLEIREDKFPDWCLDLNQPINARLLSISTGDLFSSSWIEMDCPDVEALILHIFSSDYALPSFIAGMTILKVLTVTNHRFNFAKLSNFSCLSSLPNLKRIRLEKALITLLDILQLRLTSLEKLSLFKCSFGEVFYDMEGIDVSKALPSLQEIDINYCYDPDELPYWLFEVVSLKTLSITNTNNLYRLPEELGKLSKLETLRLTSCKNLCELPETTARLNNLRFLDISDCTELRKLPLDIGKLKKLKKISMRSCWKCALPESVKNLENLEVRVSEASADLWKNLKPIMRNLIVNVET